MTNNRRDLLKKLSTGAVLSLASSSLIASEACGSLLTPEQPLGPFYPRSFEDDTNTDLTKVDGRLLHAEGEFIIVKGIVQDDSCRPVKSATVEIWQACKSGKYNHPSDTSNNKLDPNFQYYGQAITNSKGEYSFKTILPGKYNATSSWVRPPHIHFQVSLRGYEVLVTQLYFKGEKLNKEDRILQDLVKADQNEVIIDFKKENQDKERTGVFNIKLKEL